MEKTRSNAALGTAVSNIGYQRITRLYVHDESFKICPRNFTGELAKKLCKNGFTTDFEAGARALCDYAAGY